MAKTRDRIAAAAKDGGWELTTRTAGSLTYVRAPWRVFVEFGAHGGVNYASRSKVGGGVTGQRFTGAGKAEQVIAALAEPGAA